jgi:hypothetical protein
MVEKAVERRGCTHTDLEKCVAMFVLLDTMLADGGWICGDWIVPVLGTGCAGEADSSWNCCAAC